MPSFVSSVFFVLSLFVFCTYKPLVYLLFVIFLSFSFVLKNIIFSTFICILFLWKCFIRFNLAYHYDSANVITLILKNITKGQKFWINDINTLKIRNYIHKKYSIEVFKPVDIMDKTLLREEKSSFIKNIIIFMTLNGHLFPLPLSNKKSYYIDILEKYRMSSIFLKNNITVYDEVNNVGYQVQRNCYYFFKNLLSMIFYTLVFMLKFPFIKKGFCSFYEKLKNGIFWRSLYKQSQS